MEEGRESKSTIEMLNELMMVEGFEGMYRGLSPVLQSLWCSNFVYFYSFHGLRSMFAKQEHSATRDLTLAAVAGVVNVLLTTPMWVVNTRMKMQGAKGNATQYNYASITDGLARIYRWV